MLRGEEAWRTRGPEHTIDKAGGVGGNLCSDESKQPSHTQTHTLALTHTCNTLSHDIEALKCIILLLEFLVSDGSSSSKMWGSIGVETRKCLWKQYPARHCALLTPEPKEIKHVHA